MIYEWRFHPKHGYMLRTNYEYDWCMVVTALCNGTAEYQKDPELWEKHLSRLHVNAGCGGVCAGEMYKSQGVNPDFEIVSSESVPPYIVKAFMEVLND